MTWRRYWPWWVAILWLIGYEGVALVTDAPTLSRMVWTAHANWSALSVVVAGLLIVLWFHFFVRRR